MLVGAQHITAGAVEVEIYVNMGVGSILSACVTASAGSALVGVQHKIVGAVLETKVVTAADVYAATGPKIVGVVGAEWGAEVVMCLGCNKDLWSWRSKYKSYGALRGCDLGARDCLQVCCGK